MGASSSRSEVAAGLARVARALERDGMAVVEPQGRMIRPLLAHAVQSSRGWAADAAFWRAVAAVQYAHEASLVHDDILDDAEQRRGEPTYVAARGVKAALVRGDHVLTTAYRLAASTGSATFAGQFARAVERTVAGEVRQASSAGTRLTEAEYREVVVGKSGELLGCALAAGAAVRGDASAEALYELGCRLGVCYQMLDDLVDFCPESGSGKPPLQDYRNRYWTWPLSECDVSGFGLEPAEVASRMHAPGAHGSPSAARRCLVRLGGELSALARDFEATAGPIPLVARLLDEWRHMARSAVEGAERALPAAPRRAALALPDEASWNRSLARHARSFSFASRWFPRRERRRVADVYAFCRFTDDLVDGAEASDTAVAGRLDDWLALCRTAYVGGGSGLPFLDRVMRDASSSGVPFSVVEELVEGMRMDLDPTRYASLTDLRVYTHRVAGVVGVWLTHLFGVHAPAVLDRASLLGHAMQITNILRDVGEDLDRGRIYLPGDLMARHGVGEADLHVMRRTGVPTQAYVRLLEALMAHADEAYDAALDALPALPGFFRRPVAVAARVYRGIHDAIRGNGYDNFTRRAHTTGFEKAALALRALTESRVWRSAHPAHARPGIDRPGAQSRSPA
jgi:phytoene synthase